MENYCSLLVWGRLRGSIIVIRNSFILGQGATIITLIFYTSHLSCIIINNFGSFVPSIGYFTCQLCRIVLWFLVLMFPLIDFLSTGVVLSILIVIPVLVLVAYLDCHFLFCSLKYIYWYIFFICHVQQYFSYIVAVVCHWCCFEYNISWLWFLAHCSL
jgi:hypothetical protein